MKDTQIQTSSNYIAKENDSLPISVVICCKKHISMHHFTTPLLFRKWDAKCNHFLTMLFIRHKTFLTFHGTQVQL